jgi:chromosome segregation protein
VLGTVASARHGAARLRAGPSQRPSGAAADAVAVPALVARRGHRAGPAQGRRRGRAGLVVTAGAAPVTSRPRPPSPDGASGPPTSSTDPTELQARSRRRSRTSSWCPSLDDARALVAARPTCAPSRRRGPARGPPGPSGARRPRPSQLEVQGRGRRGDRGGPTRGPLGAGAPALRARRGPRRRRAAVGRRRAVPGALHASDARWPRSRAARTRRVRRPGRRGRGRPTGAGEGQGRAGPRPGPQRARRAGAAPGRGRAAPAEAEPSNRPARNRLAAAATAARATELEARLAVRTGEERARALGGRAEALERTARQSGPPRAPGAGTGAARAAAAVAAEVADAAAQAAPLLAASLAAARPSARRPPPPAPSPRASCSTCGPARATLTGELERLTDAVHRDEVARAEQRLRIEALEERARRRVGRARSRSWCGVRPRRARPGPSPRTGSADEQAEPAPYERAAQERRAASAERALARLGKVNPLALEEYAALEERSAFLATQLEDLRPPGATCSTSCRDVDAASTRSSPAPSRTPPASSCTSSRRCSRRGGPARAHRPDGPAHHRHRGARPAGRQEGLAAVAAVGRRALADRDRLPRRAVPAPAVPVLRAGRGRGALDDRNLGRLLELLGELRDAASSSSSPTRSARWRSPTRSTA